MRRYDVVLQARNIQGNIQVSPDDAGMYFLDDDGLLVNDEPVRHHGFSIGFDDTAGFLVLTLKNVEEDEYNAFMSDKTPDDVLEGTGIPMFTGKIDSNDRSIHYPDALVWAYGCDIVIPINSLTLKALEPALPEVA